MHPNIFAASTKHAPLQMLFVHALAGPLPLLAISDQRHWLAGALIAPPELADSPTHVWVFERHLSVLSASSRPRHESNSEAGISWSTWDSVRFTVRCHHILRIQEALECCCSTQALSNAMACSPSLSVPANSAPT